MRTLLLSLLSGCIALYVLMTSFGQTAHTADAATMRHCVLAAADTAFAQKAAMTSLPISTILSEPEIAFYSTEVAENRYDLGFLQADMTLLEQAQVTLKPANGALTIQLAPSACALDTQAQSDSSLLTLEHLYGVVLASGVDTRFSISQCERSGACNRLLLEGASQYAALREIVRLRQEKLSSLANAHLYKSWIAYEITQAKADHDDVTARVESDQGPVVGQVVAFAKAPHLGCFATTNSTGLAQCALEDYHGHDGHDHDEHEADQFTVTLTGGKQGQAVVLPISRTFGMGTNSAAAPQPRSGVNAP